MEVYCSHVNRTLYREYYNVCDMCGSEWYKGEAIPLKIIGFTTTFEVESHNLYRTDIHKIDN